ncbi:hypothetical protein P691DRAFT_678920, partial [Macrolepiota fuliginosa MF-IS2]
PHSPHIDSIPLPSPITVINMSTYQPATDFYPFSIFTSLTSMQQTVLQSIQLRSPVHVHTPMAHIGTLHGSFTSTSTPGRYITALNAFLFLQSLAASPLDSPTVFSRLSSDMKVRVRAAFYRRNTISPSFCTLAWERFISGQHVAGGPLGIDVLLGSSKVWGFESFSLTGYSVIHLTNSDSFSA